MRLEVSVLNILLTEFCTLSCKLCANKIPYAKHPKMCSLEQTKRELDAICNLMDYAKIFCPIGGETLLAPTLPDVIRYSVKHKDKFGALRIVTNGTRLPGEDLLLAIEEVRAEMRVEFLVSDYGALSTKKDELIAIINDRDLPLRIDKYHGSDQRFNGWVDYGFFEDRQYTQQELYEVWSDCAEAHHGYINVHNGIVTVCCHAWAAFLLEQEGFHIDSLELFSDSMTSGQKQEAIKALSEKPMNICKRCNGQRTYKSKRYPAAEQIR